MNVVLIGYRGTGKSTVADLVAGVLGATPFHTDLEIERRIGQSITDFVASQGWDAFRDIESEVVKTAGRMEEAVIDTGGGVVTRPENIAALKENGVVFWLQASPQTIRDRISDSQDRPSLTGDESFMDEVEAVLKERIPLYEGASDYAVTTDGRKPDEIAARVVMLLDQRNRG
jgi:shikimate kinase